MEIIFISDGLKKRLDQVGAPAGGAELCDDVLINALSARDHTIRLIQSRDVTVDIIEKNDVFYIVSNFIQLRGDCKKALEKRRYIIFEHDHKYILTRNPSDFQDFVVPKKFLVNVSFYESALAVCAQTKMHAGVISKNLPNICNIVNLGCSLWSDEALSTLESFTDNKREYDCGVLQSANPIKNTDRAKKFCEDRSLDYDIFGDLSFEQLMERMSKCEAFAFFPTTLETCCRLLVEARMLNCKIHTNGLIGATSEDWFKLKGKELISFVRGKKEEIVDTIESYLDQEGSGAIGREITVILNAYRRTHLLKEQIEKIRNQSIKPKQIWVWVNHHEDADDYDFDQCGADRVFLNDHNWKFYGRFAAALLADTEYIAMFDDDTMPGENWLKNCVQTMKVQEGILGGIGVQLHSNQYADHVRHGWATNNEEIVEVDLVGHAWFFKREWLSYLWSEKPSTWENAEDIQFAYLAQKLGGIGSFVPPHPESDPSKNSSLQGYELGVDDKAASTASNHHIFYPERDLVIQNAVANGWTLLKDR